MKPLAQRRPFARNSLRSAIRLFCIVSLLFWAAPAPVLAQRDAPDKAHPGPCGDLLGNLLPQLQKCGTKETIWGPNEFEANVCVEVKVIDRCPGLPSRVTSIDQHGSIYGTGTTNDSGNLARLFLVPSGAQIELDCKVGPNREGEETGCTYETQIVECPRVER
jgi:hypothetical protein